MGDEGTCTCTRGFSSSGTSGKDLRCVESIGMGVAEREGSLVSKGEGMSGSSIGADGKVGGGAFDEDHPSLSMKSRSEEDSRAGSVDEAG